MTRATIPVWKSGSLVRADVSAARNFTPVAAWEPIDRSRVFAIDSESLRDAGGQLRTVLTLLRFHDSSVAIETRHGRGMVESWFDALYERPDFPFGPIRASQVAQRSKDSRAARKGRSSGRDGDRVTIPPIIAVFFNLEYDIGRLFADRATALRSLTSGADAYSIQLDGYTLEVRRMIRGAAPSFEWRVKCHSTHKWLRIIAIDLAGYWKTSLATAAETVGGHEKLDIEGQIDDVFERAIDKFTPEEWAAFTEYGLGDVESTLDLYHRTVALLQDIDARVVKRQGILPPSGPGAAARITFARAFDMHPMLPDWRRPGLWADEMGAKAYAAGRSFCCHPGVFKGMEILDLKSAYPFQLAVLPDPVTMNTVPMPTGPFDWRQYRGAYGAVLVSAKGLDSVYPALRIHDPVRQGRLRYLYGSFDHVWTTLPELVIGCARGALKDVVVHKGVLMEGSPERSFFRSAMIDFFQVKENAANPGAYQAVGKLLAVSVYGKLMEVKSNDYLVPDHVIVPKFTAEVPIAQCLTQLYADQGAVDRVSYWGSTEAIARAAREYYQAVFVPSDSDPGESAVHAYIEALCAAGEPYEENRARPLRDFLLLNRKYRCGHYFMPLYAAQVTGATSAMLGAMAACLKARQGDTDSVHFMRPAGVPTIDAHPGFQQYFTIMERAGYPSPRRTPAGIVGGIPEVPTLGLWELKTAHPSDESILVRPKVYSHLFETADGLQFTQARHGFTHFEAAEAAWARKHGQGSRTERETTARRILQHQLHEAIRELLVRGTTAYVTRGRPRSLREAALSKKEVGEFINALQTLSMVHDPGTTLDAEGVLRWLPLSAEERRALASIGT